MDKLKQTLREAMEREREELRQLRTFLGKISRVVGDASFKDKATWPGLAERVLGAVVDGQGLHDDVHSYMDANGRQIVAEDIPIAMHHFGLNRDEDVVFDQDSTRAFRAVTDQGHEFFVLHYNDNVEWDLFLHSETPKAVIFEYLARKLWQGKEALRLDLHATSHYASEIVMSGLKLGEHRYIGALEERIDEWKKFRAAHIRRNVLLQGKPGCGKSTLCLHAASVLSQRTALITSKVFEECTLSEWRTLLDLLQPEMLILDDIDRVGPNVLGTKLETIEEKNCDIPFIMFTSNDIEQIPQAFRRPGRIDQILVVDEPSEVARRLMLERFAQQLQVKIPQEKWDDLLNIVLSQSGAHALEAIKRGKVLGWDHPLSTADITFKSAKEESEDDDD